MTAIYLIRPSSRVPVSGTSFGPAPARPLPPSPKIPNRGKLGNFLGRDGCSSGEARICGCALPTRVRSLVAAANKGPWIRMNAGPLLSSKSNSESSLQISQEELRQCSTTSEAYELCQERWFLAARRWPKRRRQWWGLSDGDTASSNTHRACAMGTCGLCLIAPVFFCPIFTLLSPLLIRDLTSRRGSPSPLSAWSTPFPQRSTPTTALADNSRPAIHHGPSCLIWQYLAVVGPPSPTRPATQLLAHDPRHWLSTGFCILRRCTPSLIDGSASPKGEPQYLILSLLCSSPMASRVPKNPHPSPSRPLSSRVPVYLFPQMGLRLFGRLPYRTAPGPSELARPRPPLVCSVAWNWFLSHKSLFSSLASSDMQTGFLPAMRW